MSVSGTNLSTTVDGSGQFTLNNVPAGDVTLQFTGPNTNASVTISGVASGQQLQITVTVSGSSASLDSEHGGGNNSSVQLEGLIGSIDLTARTIVVNGTTVSVPATASITHGSTTLQLSDLQVGQRVHVKGTNQSGTVVATQVMLQDQSPAPPTTQQADVSGTLAAAPTGTCPAVTFTVGSDTVTTTASTVFKGGTCADLAAGVKVDVKGTTSSGSTSSVTTSGTTITATQVSMDLPQPQETSVKGAIAAAPTGTCPAVTFSVAGSTVTTTASTSFQGGTCATLAAGTEVQVDGTVSGSTITATKVSIETETTQVQGTLTAAPTGTCPAVSFVVGASTVTTSASTTFQGGACSDLAAGVKVSAQGTASGSTLAATTVSIQKSGQGGDGDGGGN
ncbi:MAG: hypothetical protein KGN76_08450 [Acidobacteriota bacterium]|nr:hypothetical protein [Acidobacteriota bacterium]